MHGVLLVGLFVECGDGVILAVDQPAVRLKLIETIVLFSTLIGKDCYSWGSDL